MITGICVNPAAFAARKRRSPITNSYFPLPAPPTFLTTGGCKIPTSLIEVISSFKASSSKTVRG